MSKIKPIRRSQTLWREIAIGIAIVVSAIGLGWQEREWLLQHVGSWWVVSDQLASADAIIVLGGELDVRPFAAAELYRQGYASRILVSNVRLGRAEQLGVLPSHTQLNRDVLSRLGVPDSAIVTFGDNLSNTHEEAKAVRAWALKSQATRVIIPTDIFATRRTRWAFEQELSPVGVEVIVRSFPALNYTLEDWWRHSQGVVGFDNEILKYFYYRARY